MKTKLIPGRRPKFYFYQKEFHPSLPVFVLPGLWWERKRQGLEIRMLRVSVGFLRRRWHWYFGTITTAPAGSLTSESFQVSSLVQWLSTWSGRKIEQTDFEAWLLQSEWKTLVRWGGAKYHYSRILLGKEFLSDTEHAALDVLGEDMDLTLTFTDDNTAPTSE